MSTKLLNLVDQRNVVGFECSENDYRLVFVPDADGIWRERSQNLPKFLNMLLADYLALMHVPISDYTQFMRIVSPDYYLEYRSYGSKVVIDYTKRI